jgi:hypothetical protein
MILGFLLVKLLNVAKTSTYEVLSCDSVSITASRRGM